MIEAGKYRAKATGQVVLGTSEKKGTPFIELYFRVIDVYPDGVEGANHGEEVRWTSYFTEATSKRTIEALQYCGWSGEDLSEFADGELHGLDTNEIQIVVEVESYTNDQGEERATPKVQWVNKLGGFLNVKNAMKKDAAASFGEKMRGLVLKTRSKTMSEDSGTDFPVPAVPEPKQASGAKRGW